MHELFEAFGIDWRLLIAQAVNFGIVLVALTYFLYKPVMKTLDERRKVVSKGVEDAQEAARTLAEAGGEASKRVKAADTEAEEILKSARASANAAKSELLAEAEARAASLEKDAEARAKEAAAKTLRESEKEIARLAVLAAEKVLREKA